MKVKHTLFPLIVLFLTVLCNWNGSIIGENETKEPGISFYGELSDHYRTAPVEDILIGKKYQSIPVYQTLSAEDRKKTEGVDPKLNKILIDLKEVFTIELKHPENPTASEIELKGRKYVEIIVTSIHKTQKHFLIESSRKITCKEEDKLIDPASVTTLQTSTFVDRDLNFIHVKKLTIKGWKSEHQVSAPSQDEKTDIKKDTSHILDDIEKNIKNLPENNPTLLLQVKETLITLLKLLRAQLQKIVNMIP
jgi:hypothetical protein